MPYIVKVEISGIQEFIFGVKTKAAAKSLKGRSYLVDAACILISENIKGLFSSTKEIYVGGGNVYVEINDNQWCNEHFKTLISKIKGQLLDYQLILNWTSSDFKSLDNFGECISKVNRKLNFHKLQAGVDNDNFFQAFSHNKVKEDAFATFAKSYSNNTSSSIKKVNSTTVFEVVSDNGITLGNYSLQFTKNTKRTLIPLPIWNLNLFNINKTVFDDINDTDDLIQAEDVSKTNPDIIGFNYLASFAKRRTGTKKIGVLKLDIDNLGTIFQQIKNREQSEFLSKNISSFFNDKLIEILNKPFFYKAIETDNKGDAIFSIDKFELNNKKNEIKKYKVTNKSDDKFCDNIYPVFAGGDDCLFIGAWDAIIEFAQILKAQFDLLQLVIRKDITTLKGPITISAAILILDPHYPVIRFADMVDSSLEAAKAMTNASKMDAAGEPEKNNISIMGHVFTWQQFNEMTQVKDVMRSMILEYGEPAAFLQRVIQSFDSTDISKWHFCNPPKPFNPAILWRFIYSFRDTLDKPFFEKHFKSIFFNEQNGYYKKYIDNYFSSDKTLSQIIPVAARLTEFSTKSKIS
jgi:CRISPR-associated protein Csm1